MSDAQASLQCPFFSRLRAGLPSFTNSNNPRAVEPESAGSRQSKLRQSLSPRRDDFIVSVKNLGFNVCPDRPQLPPRLDKNEPMGKECKNV
jgi:hypothetical protein